MMPLVCAALQHKHGRIRIAFVFIYQLASIGSIQLEPERYRRIVQCTRWMCTPVTYLKRQRGAVELQIEQRLRNARGCRDRLPRVAAVQIEEHRASQAPILSRHRQRDRWQPIHIRAPDALDRPLIRRRAGPARLRESRHRHHRQRNAHNNNSVSHGSLLSPSVRLAVCRSPPWPASRPAPSSPLRTTAQSPSSLFP